MEHLIIPDESKYDWFYLGFIYKIPICCILFFCFEWQSIKQKIPEYSNIMQDENFIKCPECVCRLFEDLK